MQRRLRRQRFESNDQRAAFFQMLLQIVPASAKSKSGKCVLVKVTFQVRGVNSVRLTRVQIALDCTRIGAGNARSGLLLLPILHDHGDAGGAATVFLLLHERDIKPDARTLRSKANAAETQQYCASLRQATNHTTAPSEQQ